MTVSIDSRWEDMLDTLVREGRYASREEAVAEAMRLLDEQETEFRELKQSIADALADPRRYTMDEVMEHVEKELAEWKATQAAAE